MFGINKIKRTIAGMSVRMENIEKQLEFGSVGWMGMFRVTVKEKVTDINKRLEMLENFVSQQGYKIEITEKQTKWVKVPLNKKP